MAHVPFGSAVFVGCARSCSRHLDKVFENIAAMAATYEQSAIVIVENDSDDDTPAKLIALQGLYDNVTIINMPSMADSIPVRTKRLARCRNEYINFIKNNEYSSYDDLIVLDLDDINEEICSAENFISARKYLHDNEDMNGVFANSQPIYYDIWTIRHDEWCPGDCWAEVREAGTPEAAQDFVFSRMRPILPTAAPIIVKSAFGGLGIYKMSRAINGRYEDPTPPGTGQCCHVAFHESIVEKCGGTFAILPFLTNGTGWDHVIGEFDQRLKQIELHDGDRTARLFALNDHVLNQYRAWHRLYDRRLPELSRLVSEAAPGTAFLDVGGNIGDTAALCRLAGCSLDIKSVEASLSHYKLMQYNCFKNPDLFRNVEPVWGFVGRAEDQTALWQGAGTASLFSGDGRTQIRDAVLAPKVMLEDLANVAPSLIKTDTDGYDHVILEANFEFLEKSPPVIWAEAQVESVEDEAAWLNLLHKMAAKWPKMMAFDNYGFCLVAGSTRDNAQFCAAMISASRRYRRAHAAGISDDPRIYYLDIALFPKRYFPVYRKFKDGLAELVV